MLNRIYCVNTFENIFNRIHFRILARLDGKALVSHVLKRDNLGAHLVLRELFPRNMLVFHMVRTIHASVHAVI